VFDSPASSKKPSAPAAEKFVATTAKSDTDATAEQLAANLSRSALLH